MTNADTRHRDTTARTIEGERATLLAGLAHTRFFLRHTTRELTTEQASRQTTASSLSLGGLIKHVTGVERGWAQFIVSGASAMTKNGRQFADWTPEDFAEREREFHMTASDTLEAVLDDYAQAAADTDELVRKLESFDTVQLLPEAPWNTEDAWSVRRVLLHIIIETSQHAGHADIIRESLDGAQSMA